ncbi:MAG: tyrosine-type recombinase/integrase [Kiritimatiellae bacterium]|nr:tyrosine-type recombinase/integrase [Kiritimatiellia bacterium]
MNSRLTSKEGNMQILEALARFQTQLEADGRSIHTRRQYDRHVRLFAHWARTGGHSGALDAIDHPDVARFLASPQARTRPDGRIKKATAMNALRSSIRTFFHYCHEAGFVVRNPARLVRRALCSPPPPRALSEEEAKRLLARLAQGEGPEAERDHALFHLMLATGIRLGSAIALDVEDVDLDVGEIFLRTAKSDRRERVILGRAIRAHLRRFLGARTVGPLFVGLRGKRISDRHAQRRYRQWVQKAGIARATSTHTLRHTLATRLYQRTGDLFLVQAALHHKSISSTAIYATVTASAVRCALDACAEA